MEDKDHIRQYEALKLRVFTDFCPVESCGILRFDNSIRSSIASKGPPVGAAFVEGVITRALP